MNTNLRRNDLVVKMHSYSHPEDLSSMISKATDPPSSLVSVLPLFLLNSLHSFSVKPFRLWYSLSPTLLNNVHKSSQSFEYPRQEISFFLNDYKFVVEKFWQDLWTVPQIQRIVLHLPVIHVILGERNNWHDPVNPAHGAGNTGVAGRNLTTTPLTMRHSSDLEHWSRFYEKIILKILYQNISVVLVEAHMRGSTISITSIFVRFSTNTQEGGMSSARW